MNTLEIYFEKGIEKGMEKGIEKGKELIVQNLIASGKFTTSEISGVAGVSQSFVLKVEENMKNKNCPTIIKKFLTEDGRFKPLSSKRFQRCH